MFLAAGFCQNKPIVLAPCIGVHIMINKRACKRFDRRNGSFEFVGNIVDVVLFLPHQRALLEDDKDPAGEKTEENEVEAYKGVLNKENV